MFGIVPSKPGLPKNEKRNESSHMTSTNIIRRTKPFFDLKETDPTEMFEIWKREANFNHTLSTMQLDKNTCSTDSIVLQHWHLETKEIPFFWISMSTGTQFLYNFQQKMETEGGILACQVRKWILLTGFLDLIKDQADLVVK